MLSRSKNLSYSPAAAASRKKAQTQDAAPVFAVRTPAALQALAHPLRVRILEALREPASAAAAARDIGQSRQKVNYHLKELEDAGLVRPTGERRVGNFVETLYQSVARSFVVSPEVAWAGPQRGETLRNQHSLQTLVHLGDRLGRDAAALLDRATFDDEEIPSASVVAEARFETEADREAFLTGYAQAVTSLLEQYGNKRGVPYRVVLAAYPRVERSEE